MFQFRPQPGLNSLGVKLWDLTTPFRVFTVFNGVFLMFPQLMSPETGQFMGFNRDWVVWLRVRDPR